MKNNIVKGHLLVTIKGLVLLHDCEAEASSNDPYVASCGTWETGTEDGTK